MNRNPDRPNVVFILTDDQGPWAMGCAGNRELRTPNLDRLAATGTRFESFFCASPVCSPARATIVTGRIPSQHGVHDWLRAGNTTAEPERGGELIEYLRGQTGYTDVLAAAGYVCGISGKWHLGDCHHVQKSFSYWHVHAKGGGPYYNAPMIRDGELHHESAYVTDVITDNALRFLDQCRGDDRPFYLSVHYTAPHSPWGRDQHPADIYDSYHRECPFESVPDIPGHPWFHSPGNYPTGEHRRETLSGYFAAVTAMDTNVGRVLDWLEAEEMRDNTLVVFTSDNGMSMGHHGIYGKGNGTFPINMFDTAVKVPTIVSRPGYVRSGAVSAELLSHYDIMPTLLDYTGVGSASEDGLPGISFAPLLRGEALPERGPVVVFDEYGPVRMIRTAEHKYVHRFAYGPNELYDLVQDPDEERNVVNLPEYGETVREMRSRLREWFSRYVRPEVDGAYEPVTGSGQVGLAGLGSDGGKSFTQDRTSPFGEMRTPNQV